MTSAAREWLLLALLVLLGLLHCQANDLSFKPIRGKVATPGSDADLSDAYVLIVANSGHRSRAYCNADGDFTITDLPPGKHLLQPVAVGYVYPEALVDVSSKGSLVAASYAYLRQPLQTDPLVLQPVMVAQYYEKRKPVDVLGFFKSPMGLMVGFGIFMMVVLPRLKVDPEELAQLREEARGGGGSSQQQQQQRLRDR